MFTSIVKVENNRIEKFAEFATEPEAQAHCEKYGGFVYQGYYSPDLYVNGETVTVQMEQETAEQVIKRLESLLDRHLDATANQYRYESIRTMVTYEGDPDPEFDAQGTAAKKYRSAIYRLGINKIAACTREVDPLPIPSEAELIAELPLFEDFLQA